MELAIKTDKLTKIYGYTRKEDAVRAVNELSMEVPKGEAFGFLGPNGAGKTTTIYMLLGILKPTSGNGKLLGKPLGNAKAKEKLGFLPESVTLHLHHTGLSLLDYYGELLNMEGAKRKKRALEVLEQVGLKDAGNKLITSYSKGMVQRLGLAQALISDPDLLILDEPTANLDPIGRKEVKDLLLNIKEQKKTIFISSHILSDVESICDRVCILKGGRLIKTGTIEELTRAKDKVEIRTKDLSTVAIEKIKNLGCEVNIKQDEIQILLDNKEKEFGVIEIIRQSDCPLLSISQDKDTLEDIFYTAVKGENK
jgi:ABC-2 type transport system ATP-binding protein